MADPTLLSTMDQTIVLQAENGTSFGPSSRISLLVPSSIKAFVPSETYLTFDFTIDESGVVGNIVESGGEEPVPELTATSTGAMFQINPFTGVHSLIRDLYLYDNAGRELDSTRNYDVCAMGHIPYSMGDDEMAFSSNQTGAGVWLSRPNSLPEKNNVENQTRSSYAADLYYQPYLQNSSLAQEAIGDPINVRVQRFTFPLSALGFFKSNSVFPNISCGGTRLDILLQNKQKSLGKIYDGSTYVGDYVAATQIMSNISITGLQAPSYLDLFRRGLCVGTRVVIQDSAGDYFQVPIVNISQLAGPPNRVEITLGPSAAVNGPVRIIDVSPQFLPNWRIDNVQFFVRETMMDASSMSALNGGASYTWISHYNVPQSMTTGSFNPTINWNVLPVNQCLGLVAIPYDEVAGVWGSTTYNGAAPGNTVINPISYQTYNADLFGGYNQEKYMFALESGAFSPVVQAYQWQIGTELQPSQADTTIMKEVPQYQIYELKNYFAAMGQSVYSFKLMSFDNDGTEDSFNVQPANAYDTGTADKRILYNRQFTLALAPSPNQVLSLVDKPVQLRLENTNVAFQHNHTWHLYITHYRTAVLSPNGSSVMI